MNIHDFEYISNYLHRAVVLSAKWGEESQWTVGGKIIIGIDFSNAPACEILAEGTGTIEHGRHGYDIACIPVIQWLIESNISARKEEKSIKHPWHIRDTACVPCIQWLIEGNSK